MEFTQEQVDQMIAEKIAEAKQGLFTEEELTRRVTAEVDRRVETGIQKGLETQKSKWEKEFSEKAKLTAEELAQKELEQAKQELSTKERDILKKANLIEAKELLANADIPKSHYEKFIGILVSDNEETTKANVSNFIDMFNATKSDIETKVKSEFSKVPQPNTGNGDKPVTKEDFNKLTYGQKLDFKKNHPEQYAEFMK